MSQLPSFGLNNTDPLAVPLIKFEQFIDLFKSAEKIASQKLIGIEYEMFAHDQAAHKPLSYEGPTSISAFFAYLVKSSAHSPDPYEPIYENENIVALSGQRAIIALEPGGQIEVAARPQASLAQANKIFRELVLELDQAANNLGIKLFAVGVHPLAARTDMAQVKKIRYEIMRSYMGGLKGLGIDMMTRSCAIQINLDYFSEPDMVRKTRLAAKLIPFFSILCSSSAFINGQPPAQALPRSYIWQETDPQRTGIPEIIFAPNFGYEAWINWVLDVPMYFIRREDNYIDMSGQSFRTFWAQGFKQYNATLRDFADHLSTAFPEVRLKPILELRSPDSLPVIYVEALTALAWAIFYCEPALTKTENLLANLGYQELITLREQVIRLGRQASCLGHPIFNTCQELLKIASSELAPELAGFLQVFQNILDKNITIAEHLKNTYQQINPDNLSNFINQTRVLGSNII